MIIEPRNGDAEDDLSSTKTRSLLAIAGSLLGEISMPEPGLAWVIGALLPSLLLGAGRPGSPRSPAGWRRWRIPAGALDPSAAPSSDRVSETGESNLGTHRNHADQRQPAAAAIAADRGPHGRDAWSPPYRLDRPLRSAQDRFRALPGHGSERRRADLFLHPHIGGGSGRNRVARTAAHRDRARPRHNMTDTAFRQPQCLAWIGSVVGRARSMAPEWRGLRESNPSSQRERLVS